MNDPYNSAPSVPPQSSSRDPWTTEPVKKDRSATPQPYMPLFCKGYQDLDIQQRAQQAIEAQKR